MRTAFRSPTGLTCCAVLALVAASACGDDGRPENPGYATGGRDPATGTGGRSTTSGGRAGAGTGGSASCTDCQGGASGEPGVCGDGQPDPGETCDDGNLRAEDGCTPECLVEPGWLCPLSEPCRKISTDGSCADACWDGDACIENDSGVTCSCPEERPEACEGIVFRGLLHPEGWSACDALGLSADGSTVVGACSRIDQDTQEPVTVPAVWELGGGVRVLDDAPEGSVLNAVNADGTVFVGSDRFGRALRFADGDSEVLAEAGVAWSTSADGSVVVGFDGARAFRWDTDAGVTLLDAPESDAPEGETETYALAVSADGTWVAGLVRDSGHSQAVRWNADGEPELLPVPEEATESQAVAINDDGSVIVGTLWVDDESQAVRWTEDGFEVLPGDSPSSAHALSADGSKIVGVVAREPGFWNEAGEFESLRDTLSDANLEGWSFNRVACISADGSVLAGTGNYVGTGDASPEARAFVAFLP